MTRDAAFYFANLGADVARCLKASGAGDEARYQESLARAHQTLEALRGAARPEAYEEGLLLLRGLELSLASHARRTAFEKSLAVVITPFATRLVEHR